MKVRGFFRGTSVLNKQSLFFCDPYFDDALTKQNQRKSPAFFHKCYVVNGSEWGLQIIKTMFCWFQIHSSVGSWPSPVTTLCFHFWSKVLSGITSCSWQDWDPCSQHLHFVPKPGSWQTLCFSACKDPGEGCFGHSQKLWKHQTHPVDGPKYVHDCTCKSPTFTMVFRNPRLSCFECQGIYF